MGSRRAAGNVVSSKTLPLFLFILHFILHEADAVSPVVENRKEPQTFIIGGGFFPPFFGHCPGCPPLPGLHPPAYPVPIPPPPEPEYAPLPPTPSPPPPKRHPPPPPSPPPPRRYPPPPPPPEPECDPSPPPPPPPMPECPPLPSPSPHPPPKHPPPPPPRHPPPPPPSPPPPPRHPPPPPPAPAPKPKPSPSPLPIELQTAINAIQKFKPTITHDPFGITRTWTGNKICKDSSTYKGFVCDTTIQDNKTRIAIVNFNGFNFDGKPLGLNNFLNGFPDLIALHVNSNNFTGEIPLRPSKIQSLFELDLSNNGLQGEFPRTILTSASLTFLDLRFNKLSGKIPPEVFILDLDVLYLNNNKFEGTIPENLGKTPALYLTLANNKLSGQIPRSIGQASDTLLEALLRNNQLSGCLPFEIGLLKKATFFDASVNHLTGPIPHSFGCLKNMQILDLSYNQLYGAVPESLCKLGNLYELTLKSNYFTQVGPECRKLIASKVLDVKRNCILDLPLQRSAEECETFFLKERSCPDPRSMNYVPCKIDYSAKQEKSPPERKLMTKPRSYAALQRHRP